ncbi:hypothetical protein GCM10011399_22530 [Subtercola lobariae]|uniref:PIN domain-containing protein n=1 Tax=Subtercola lobariae TaxID=1588641 RepID=A0A917B712_9MICO|nr:hypothetical protein GCM10011399_22530 [Subtercola lobariae]
MAEVERNEVRKLIRRGASEAEAEGLAQRLIRTMRSGFVDAEVDGGEHLEGNFGLPDVDDEHVLAAAVIGGAGAIVTENLRDFPPSLIPHAIQILTPREFVFDTVEVDPVRALKAVRQIARRSGSNGRPKLTEIELVDTLAQRYGLTDAMDLLRLV